MKKKLLPLLLTLVLVLCAFAPTVFAKSLQFSISKSMGNVFITDNTKDLSGSVWKISNFDTAYSNFVPSTDPIDGKYDVIGFKVWNSNSTVAYSDYHTFSRFVNRYELPYATTPASGAPLRLNGRVDSTGFFSAINFEGEWIS